MSISCNYFATQTVDKTLCTASEVRTCTPKVLEDAQFRGLVLDALSRKLNVAVLSIPPVDMATVMDNADCALHSRDTWNSISDAQWQQLCLYLINQVGCTL